MRSVFMGVAMMGVMHIYFRFTQPLFIQGLMGIKSIYDAPLISIHLFGKPAVDSLQRPFKAPSMLGGKYSSTSYESPLVCHHASLPIFFFWRGLCHSPRFFCPLLSFRLICLLSFPILAFLRTEFILLYYCTVTKLIYLFL